MTDGTAAFSTYTNLGNAALDPFLSRHAATSEAGFFLPWLRPGMRVLDCGCGPGTITLGLAAAIASGLTIGIDLEPRQVDAASTLAGSRGVSNARFAAADLFRLPFPDATFDAVFAHTVLVHVSDPLRALRELRRVLKPGGVAGVRDHDESTRRLMPATPPVTELHDLFYRVRAHSGASQTYATNVRGLMLEAGFARSEVQASVLGGGNLATTRAYARSIAARVQGAHFVSVAVERGWATREQIDAMCAELLAWGERPDAFWAVTLCAAIGWAT